MDSEESYEHACMRAELLGEEKPNYGKFIQNKTQSVSCANAETKEYNLDIEDPEALPTKDSEKGSRIGEIAKAVKSTQEKIYNLAAPFSKYVKMKLGLPDSEKQKDVGPELISDHEDCDSDVNS